MRKIDNQAADLHNLRALDVLLREKHVSRAAQILRVSQPALSRTLAKLRDQFNDELLVRDGSGYTLTARGEQLIEPLQRLLADADALVHPSDFDPQQIDNEITIASLDVEMRLYLPQLLERLGRVAPKLRLRAIPFARADFGVLDSGEVDFIFVARESTAGRYRRRLLYANTHVSIMSARLAKRINHELSLEAFTSHQHGLVSFEGGGEGFVDVALRELGLARRVALRLPSFLMVPEICAARDLIFTLPERITHTYPKSAKLVSFPPPLPLPPTATYLYWHARNHVNPVNKWFRQIVFECSTEFATRR